MRASLVACLALFATSAAADAPKTAKKHVPGAIVFVLDRSGSMQGAKLDAVKLAVKAAVDSLDPADQVGVVIFDSEATTVAPLQVAGDKKAVDAKVATIQAGGGTNILPGLKVAFDALHANKLATKHVILLSDGEAPYDGIEDLVHHMHGDDKITVSTVAIAGGDEVLLGKIAKEGGGRLYAIPDLKKLTTTFVDETRIALR